MTLQPAVDTLWQALLSRMPLQPQAGQENRAAPKILVTPMTKRGRLTALVGAAE